jgi:chemotaxis response regulator CheB
LTNSPGNAEKLGARILVADHHAGMVKRISSQLESPFDFAGGATDGLVAVAATARLNPDLVSAGYALIRK